MFLQQFAIVTLALFGAVNAASSCCFVVQHEAHEVYWSEWVKETYTAIVNLTSITTYVTPYPTTTLTRYETHVYPMKKILTTSSLVTDNPVSLYTNPGFAIPQKTEILDVAAPTKTGGVVIASPTGFWVYSRLRVFGASAVTDLNGNVACGTVSSFTNVASTAPACIPTFTGINSHAAAYYDNGTGGVEISLTTPYIHVPTRTDLQINPTEACVQGDGTENYGYPVQQLINHLAGNEFYSAQYPGIESCIPAGPSIVAAKLLAVDVEPNAAAATTDTAEPDLTSTTTVTVSPTPSPTTSSTSTTPSPGTTSSTSSTTTPPTAIPESTTSVSIPAETDSALPSDLVPDNPSPTTSPPPTPQSAVTTESSAAESSTESSDTSTSSEIPSETSSEISSEASSSSEVTSEASSSVSSFLIFTSDTLLSTETVATITTPSSTEETAAPSTTVPENTAEPTSEVPTPTTVVNETTSGLTSPTLLPAFATKEEISWGLLTGFMGLVVLGVW